MQFYVIVKPPNNHLKIRRFLTSASKKGCTWTPSFLDAKTYSSLQYALNDLAIVPKGAVYFYDSMLQDGVGYVLHNVISVPTIML